MHVVATAGHVDHGKSTLVQALTGTDPDRLEEEHARGLTIELGYAWTTLAGVGEVAFVDVPGHERFVTTMLSGVGPVPAVVLVVAADDPWMPQAVEHLAALDALGVRHGLVAVTRADLADPSPMMQRARLEVDRTTLAGARIVPVSAVSGAGLDDLRTALAELVRALPQPDPASDVRLWVDRCFHVRGAGTVVTGTLPAGTVAAGDLLEVGDRVVRVRGVQSLGRPHERVHGAARVALNLAGDAREAVDRHSVLVTPRAWHHTDVLDVRLTARAGTAEEDRLPQRPMLHVGSIAAPAYVRHLGQGTARVRIARALPLRLGDRVLLRDPGDRRLWGATVLDPAPPPLRRRGAGRQRAHALESHDGTPDLARELALRGLAHVDQLRRIGVPVPRDAPATADGWLLDAGYARSAAARLAAAVEELESRQEADSGATVGALAERLGLPSPQLVAALAGPPLRLERGRVTARAAEPALPGDVEGALATLAGDLTGAPFAAPTAARLQEVGLTPRAVTLAARAGRLLHLGDGVVLLPGADARAAALLAELPQPFSTSEARVRLATSRRVVLPLLQLLDRQGRTRRHPDDRRSVTGRG